MLIIVQARFNSSRLPGKILTTINDIPLIKYITERLCTYFDKSKIIVATSKNKEDDRIVLFCKDNNLSFHRGSLNDVAGRMLETARINNARSFVRINGDSPLLDPKIVKKAIQIYKNGNYDLVTNVYPRSFPIGQSVEVIKTSTFEKAYSKMSLQAEFEHVTYYYYHNHDKFSIKNFKNDRDLSDLRLVVDTAEDLKRISIIINKMNKPYIKYTMNDIIKMYPYT